MLLPPLKAIKGRQPDTEGEYAKAYLLRRVVIRREELMRHEQASPHYRYWLSIRERPGVLPILRRECVETDALSYEYVWKCRLRLAYPRLIGLLERTSQSVADFPVFGLKALLQERHQYREGFQHLCRLEPQLAKFAWIAGTDVDAHAHNFGYDQSGCLWLFDW